MAFVVVMSATPGPNNAMVAASGATFGFARTLPHVMGAAVGFPLMLLTVALGAGGLLRAAPVLQELMKWAGVAFLLWLAFRIATARPGGAGHGLAADTARGKPLTFVQAALFQWINPKAWVIALGAIATYTTASDRSVVVQAGALAVMFFGVAAATLAFWTMTGVGAARLLRTGRALRAFNLLMAALLIASLVPLLRHP